MRKLIFRVFIGFIFLMIVISGCAPAPIPPTATPPPTPTLAPTPTQKINTLPVSISVMPFYDSQGIQVNVGNYSEQLKTDDLQVLSTMAREMAEQKEVLTPEQMYVLAIRLYELGDKDNSVYWYYEAQFRARLFQQALEPTHFVAVGDPTIQLSTAYDSFQRLAGGFINGYAGCDLDNWVKFAKMVRDDNPVAPELDQIFPDIVFVQRDQWQRINDEVAAGLTKLIDYISANGESLKQQRAQKNMDAQFCN